MTTCLWQSCSSGFQWVSFARVYRCVCALLEDEMKDLAELVSDYGLSF